MATRKLWLNLEVLIGALVAIVLVSALVGAWVLLLRWAFE